MAKGKYHILTDSAVLYLNNEKIVFRSFGSSADLDQGLVDELLKHDNIPLLSADLFATVGFTEEELKAYPTAKFLAAAPESFKQKRDQAIRLLDQEKSKALTKTQSSPASPDASAAAEEEKQ